MSDGQEPPSPASGDSWPSGGLGLAHLKTEGEAFHYDSGTPPRLTMWRRFRRKLFQISRRLRHAPGRLWWAIFGDEYY